MPIHALAVSDEVDGRIHSASLRSRMGHVDLVFGCGDLPASFLEFLADALDRPVYYVLGNHQEELTRGGPAGHRVHPLGGTDLGGRVIHDKATGLILAGLPGSPRYSGGPQQYSEFDIHWMILRMTPKLLWNRWRHGRALDVFVTHAPARDVGDRPDPAHRGFVAIRRFLGWFAPTYHLHGHVHLYDRSQDATLTFGATTVINVFPYQLLELEAKTIGQGQPHGEVAPAMRSRADQDAIVRVRPELEPPR